MAEQLERQLVVFELGNEAYGININAVREIIRMQAITSVPDSPEYVRGVINLRGRVIPVADLRRRFRLPETEANADTRVLVVDIAGEDIGVVVDAVTEVKRVLNSAVEPASTLSTTDASYYIEGTAKLENQLLILLDLEHALRGPALAGAAA